MRIGHNPIKNQSLEKKEYTHRVIIPVYIPESNEVYFQNLLPVLQLCLQSLISTVHSQTAITVIDNNCREDVKQYLQQLLKENKIQQLIGNANNEGKVDPVVSVMKSSLEPLITVTDADVLFKKGWQFEVEHIFERIPYVGMVSALPQPALYRYYNVWSWYFGVKYNCLYTSANQDIESLNIFKQSVEDTKPLTTIEEKPLYLKFNNTIATLGAGHFCATYHKAVVKYIPEKSSGNFFAGAEELFLDKPVEDAGLMRLATEKGWVFHIGNAIENWMYGIQIDNEKITTRVELASVLIEKKGFFHNFLYLRRRLRKIILTNRFKKFAKGKIKSI